MWAEVDPSLLVTKAYRHVTVLRSETIALVNPCADGVYVDCTLGGGGHTEALLQACDRCRVIGIDRDPQAVAAATERLRSYGDRFVPVRGAFAELPRIVKREGFATVHGVIAYLGLSSAQLDSAERGMSFTHEGPLDMRMDPGLAMTARELIESVDQDELANIIYKFGEERRSRSVARCIKAALEQGRLQTTSDLRRAIVKATGPWRIGGVDPATRTFQALRIVVNQELAQLESLLQGVATVLAPNAVVAIISFHSLEDRIVKRAFRQRERWEAITKKPVLASEQERSTNPRSRSAKLRAARVVKSSLPEGDAVAVANVANTSNHISKESRP